MKALTKYSTFAVLSLSVMMLASVIEANVKRRDETVEEKETALNDALSMEERQRIQTQKVVDFILDNPRFAVIEANRDQLVTSARGDLSVVQWSREILEGSQVSEMIYTDDRDFHSRAYMDRMKEGSSGLVYRFEEAFGRAEDGGVTYLRGLALWHSSRDIAICFLAPAD